MVLVLILGPWSWAPVHSRRPSWSGLHWRLGPAWESCRRPLLSGFPGLGPAGAGFSPTSFRKSVRSAPDEHVQSGWFPSAGVLSPVQSPSSPVPFSFLAPQVRAFPPVRACVFPAVRSSRVKGISPVQYRCYPAWLRRHRRSPLRVCPSPCCSSRSGRLGATRSCRCCCTRLGPRACSRLARTCGRSWCACFPCLPRRA